jgi:putative ABC transport system ATP-binding protein
MSDPSPLLAFSGITRRYGTGDAEVRALDGVDMTIAAAEFVAIMGPSGSGKSTAMNLLGCLDVPSEGTYRFMGADVGALSRDQRALLRRTYIGFVFQGFNLLPRTPAVENVELPLIYKGIPRARRRAMALDALAKVGLEGRAKHDPSELSGGQQQRVAIARAIVSRPSVIMADEPTGNLDTVTSREIMDLLTRFNVDEGITIVMVTHEPDMAEYASRVIHFRDGRIERDLSNRKFA